MRQTPPAQRSGFPWRWVKLAITLILVGAILGTILLYWQVHQLATAITVNEVRANPPLSTPLVGANLLLIGVDARPGHPEEGVRSDTLILVRLDAVGRWVSMLSIPRDSQVEIADVGT
ncbi:MAG: LytR family transcriptional regulator, partial [Oscillochloris sp.]|nr:LytR family transcriptional regulator [Oscillochloris sp.]